MSGCNTSYPVLPENIKYFVQLAYLAPGGALHMRIFWVLWVSHWNTFSKSSFFRIWALDSTVSLCQILIDTCFSRIHIYFPQLCESFSQFLHDFWMLPHIIYPVYIYMFTAKAVIHSVLSVNRMTCVVYPLRYSQMWAQHITKVTVFILIYPFFLLWNVIISEKYLDYIFGGFVISYNKRVPWASLSRFQIISSLLTLSTTFVTTVITLSRMHKLKTRLVKTEKHLCIATAWISIGFVIVVIAQAHFAWFRGNHEWAEVFYIVQCVSFDMMNVGSPIVILTASRQLRNHVLLIKTAPAPKVSTSNRTSIAVVN